MTPPLPPPSVLIVDDDEMVLATLKLTLAPEPYEVITCSNPLDALGLLANKGFAVIVSDQRMPHMMGLDFLVECRRQRPLATRILLTAYVDLTTAMDAINRGEIYRFIAKPWRSVELATAIRGAIQRHELAARNEALQAETLALNEQLASARLELKARIEELERRGPPADPVAGR
jgi:DNA-binding NtrC family response regulator